MDFQLIDQELCEARLFRASRQFSAFSGEDIAHLLYLDTMLTYMLAQDDDQAEFARKYAGDTAKFGTYSLFRTHATDAYMLAYQIAHPMNDHVKLKNAASSKKHLEGLQFQKRHHIMFMRKIQKAKDTRAEAITYLYRLEKQLKVTDARYRAWRRMIVDWPKLNYTGKQRIVAQVIQELRRRGAGSGRYMEITYGLEPMLKKVKFRNIDKPKSDTGKKIAGAVAGAIAGRYAADKINKSSNKTAKNVGTGIGAIAGYWAAGKKK